MNNVNV